MPLGRSLVALGLALVVLGFVLEFVPALRLGRLPGDLSAGGNGWRVYVPLGTSLVLSVVLSLAFAAVAYFTRR